MIAHRDTSENKLNLFVVKNSFDRYYLDHNGVLITLRVCRITMIF